MADGQCSSSLWDTHLQPGMAEPQLYSHIKEKEKKRLFTLCNHMGVWCACRCVNVRVWVHICLHVCRSYLWVHLRHRAAGYAALKGCVSAAISLSLSLCVPHSRSGSVFLCFVCVSVLFTITLPSICIPLSMLYCNCFQRTRQNVGGVSHSQPFTSSTGDNLMLFEREAG